MILVDCLSNIFFDKLPILSLKKYRVEIVISRCKINEIL